MSTKEKIYPIQGISCSGCSQKITESLMAMDGIDQVVVNAATQEVSVVGEAVDNLEMLNAMLASKGPYKLLDKKSALSKAKYDPKQGGDYYCPMRCEGDKTYGAFGFCPVCGMDLVLAETVHSSLKYRCEDHPSREMDQAGPCPECGKTTQPFVKDTNFEDPVYAGLVKKMRRVLWLVLPLFVITMQEMFTGRSMSQMIPAVPWLWIQLLLCTPVFLYIGIDFFKRGWASIQNKSPNMWTLITIGTCITFAYSLFAVTMQRFIPPEFLNSNGSPHVYFEAVSVILTLVLLGQIMEARAHNKTNDAVKSLMLLVPAIVTIVKNGQEHVVSVHDVTKGDVVRIKPGDSLPVDGKLLFGGSYVDESMLTGESEQVRKKFNDPLFAGTINGTGSFDMEAQKVGSETYWAKVIEMVRTAGMSRAPVQNQVDKIAFYFVPVVVVCALLTFVLWTIFGGEKGSLYGLISSIGVLIIACPCALGLATPMSVMVGTGKGAQEGILIKNASVLEKMKEVDVLLVDKTGTLTKGQPEIAAIYGDELSTLQLSGSVNAKSGHPLAFAMLTECKKRKIKLLPVDHFESQVGLGVSGSIDGTMVNIGNVLVLGEKVLNADQQKWVEAWEEKAATVVFVVNETSVIGMMAVKDTIRPEANMVVQELQRANIKIEMLTGDNEGTAKSVARETNIKNYKSKCLPTDKYARIQALKEEGLVVAMLGDGINDAPALAAADIGIAMGGGTGVAIGSADVVLMHGKLDALLKLRALSNAMSRNIKQNLFFAFAYNVLGIPIAAGILFPFFGLLLSPMLAAAAMSFSSVSVISNALRLRQLKL